MQVVELADDEGVQHRFRYLSGVPLNAANFDLEVNFVNGRERSPLFGTLRDSYPGDYSAAALPSSSAFAGALSTPALRSLLSR